jgi:2-dehydro-3-deoxyphosphooctonate aldolase (KDO 8-P synthase)
MSSRHQTTQRIEAQAQEVAKTGASTLLPEYPFLFCGPCQLESRDHALTLAEKISKEAVLYGFTPVFKASFDKANRTKANSPRGIGIEEAIPIFEEIQRELDLPTLTDIHLPEHPDQLGSCIDILQIPAFLCRQTDLLRAAGRSGRIVNIKKGQFLHPEDLAFAAEKVRSEPTSGPVLLCERGTFFGYRDLVVDMRGLVKMRNSGFPVIFDGSHVVQSMGGSGGVSGGDSRFTHPLCRAAVATGIDGIFIETHESPKTAPSDGDSMLPLNELPRLLGCLQKIFHAIRDQELGFLE